MMDAPKLIVVFACLAAATMIMAGSGVGGELGGTPETGTQSEFESFEDEVSTFESDTRGVDSIIGLAISAISMTATLIGILLLGPFALQNLGFPGWLAIALGLPIWAITLMFIVEIMRGINVR